MTHSIFTRHSHWHRLRWQIFWGVVASLITPVGRFAILGWDEAGPGANDLLNGTWGGLVAILIGIFLIRNIGRYPGVERAAAIIPGLSAAFGVLIVILLMVRLDYSRSVLAGAYICSIVIFYIGYTGVFGRKRLTVGVLRSDDNLPARNEISGVEWVLLHKPDDDVSRLEAVAVDLRVDLPTAWERRIADWALDGLPVYHSKHLIESLTGRVELEHLSETSFGTLSPPNAYMVPKHAADRITALLALIALLPILVIVGTAVRLDSPGGAIFRQQRVGFRGRPFTVYKFRTMRMRSAAAASGREDAITRADDDRITRLGRLLRRSRLDELPQIVNVLKGEMSWIGPRPEAAILSKWYEAEIPFYRYRHIVRPGITGWAQVMQGHVVEVGEVQSKLFYDFYYIKNFSMWIDILILFKTLRTVLNGFGAK